MDEYKVSLSDSNSTKTDTKFRGVSMTTQNFSTEFQSAIEKLNAEIEMKKMISLKHRQSVETPLFSQINNIALPTIVEEGASSKNATVVYRNKNGSNYFAKKKKNKQNSVLQKQRGSGFVISSQESMEKKNKKESIISTQSQEQTFEALKMKFDMSDPETYQESKEDEQAFCFNKMGWICSDCQNFNFEQRRKCNKCAKTRSFGYLKNKEVRRPNQNCEDHEVWICICCQNSNWSHRVKCNKCGIGRSYSEYSP